ncbi:bifunctional 2-polyprenyl-6-hydroxyphenol methylase/3-demethylubiquinol 3-O-methyltransferase UbiG [Paenibacillus sp. 32352]|uniref:class I SAM-dependent methyltransferase n=1 Tax=Paenibacillus sp. 32352 TaxID=1969111 RepID=UPI0009ADAC90|nr:class I SAM-dependent methyltransferase [Paenibacillus sp. 32352]
MTQDQWKNYHEAANQSRIRTFPNLMRYQKMMVPGKVMDLGMGVGLSALYFAKFGFEVEGYDLSDAAISAASKRAEQENIKLVIEQKDIREVHIAEEQYSLIILANVLQFFNDNDIIGILKRAKQGLTKGGLLYLSTFSTEEPTYKIAIQKAEKISDRTFFYSKNDRYIHFFTRDEIEEIFIDYKKILLLEGIQLDIGHGEPHYHGSIEAIFQK